jgi:hypothetical protein
LDLTGNELDIKKVNLLLIYSKVINVTFTLATNIFSMINFAKYFIILLLILPFSINAQTPEVQVSFAKESKTHEYYVKQAELWWKEIEKNKSSEVNWYNYFRACRNAHGTANWRDDFVKESSYLKTGPEIVSLMEQFIPNSFTFNYVAYSIQGIDPSKGNFLLKAYEINPKFEGINAAMVTYAVSILDNDLRKRVNINWFPLNELSAGLINYGYNVLMSVKPNSILLTQHDNDSYPIWMLQDVKEIRPDVLVINFDFLLLDSYRRDIFNQLGIKPLNLQLSDDYELNWKNVLNHFLSNYHNTRPLYFAMTVSQDYYKDFAAKAVISGLTYRFSTSAEDLTKLNKDLIEHDFLLDNLKIQLLLDSNQENVNKQNINYLKSFKLVFDYYLSIGDEKKANEIRELALIISKNSGDPLIITATDKDFKK